MINTAILAHLMAVMSAGGKGDGGQPTFRYGYANLIGMRGCTRRCWASSVYYPHSSGFDLIWCWHCDIL